MSWGTLGVLKLGKLHVEHVEIVAHEISQITGLQKLISCKIDAFTSLVILLDAWCDIIAQNFGWIFCLHVLWVLTREANLG